MQIVKVIYSDGSELVPDREIKPLELSKDGTENYINNRNYRRQFVRFEEDILRDLDDDTVRDYAIESFDLIDEDDVEKVDICDFTDGEIMDEARGRKLLQSNLSIISEQFISRFSKIMEKENEILLDNLLTELERKLNI